MVKAYLRYRHDGAFGVAASQCNAIFDPSGKFFVTATLETVSVWKTRSGERMVSLSNAETSKQRPIEVKALAYAPNGNLIAAGYSDGSICLWDLSTQQISARFHGHKRSITRLVFDVSGELLASGSQDTYICIWDIIEETGWKKLTGHHHEITGLCFLRRRQFLASSAKDGQLKLWELSTQHCYQTLLHEKGVIWSLAWNPSLEYIAIGSVDAFLAIYELKTEDGALLEEKWKLKRRLEGRVRCLAFSVDGKYLACGNASQGIELWEYQSEVDAEERFKKRQKEAKKILKEIERKKTKEGTIDKKLQKIQIKNERKLKTPSAPYQPYRSVSIYEISGTVLSIDFRPGRSLEMGIVTSANLFEMISLKKNENKTELIPRYDVRQIGHRSGVRSLKLSSDDHLLLSTSEKETKVWDTETETCIHTLQAGYGLCVLFCPGDDIVVIGTKNGELQMFDLLSSDLLEAIPAHEGPIWSMDPFKDASGFLTGGADGVLNLWNWESTSQDHKIVVQLSKKLKKFDSDILSLKIAPKDDLVAIALLDHTIRIFRMNTLDPFLTLYGHKLPVLTIDISADAQLIVSGSADKNLKVWGLDFGDCHKSLFAHNDSITHVAFVHTTHYVMSVGKDGLLKYWDADKFELLLQLPGHHSEIWCLCISHEGDFLYTGSTDRSIRKWVKTDEPFFLEEEKEKRFESFLEATEDFGDVPETVIGQKTSSAVTAADSIIAALDLSHEASKLNAEEIPNPLLKGLSPAEYVLQTIQNIKAGELDVALLSLPFKDTMDLLEIFANHLEKSQVQRETHCRAVTHLIRLHHHQLATSFQTRFLLQKLQQTLRKTTKELKDVAGFNLEALRFIQGSMKRNSDQ